MLRYLLIASILLSPAPALAQDQADKERALQQSGFVDPTAGLHKRTVTILPFATPADQPDLEQFGEGTMDSLTTALAALPEFIMVDRGRIQHVLQEQAFHQSGLADPRTTVRLGKLLGAQTVISGTIAAAGGGDERKITITAQFVDVASGKVTATRQVQGVLRDIFDLQEQLVQQFTTQQQVAVTPQQEERVVKVLKSTSNLTAYDYYLKGRKAFLLVSQQGYAEAVSWYRKAIEVDPRYALAHAGLAEAWGFWASWKQQTGQPNKHELEELYAAAQQAVKLNPELPEAHRVYGEALAQLGKPGGEAEVRRALDLNPNDAESWHRLWRISGNTGDPDHDYLRRALALNPDLAGAHNDRGAILARVHRMQEAISEEQAALRINPNMEMTHFNLGRALFSLGSYDQALGHYREAVRLNPEFALAHSALGDVLNAQQHYADALAAYQEALRLNPDAAYAHQGMGQSLAGLKRYDEAVTAFRQAVKLDPALAASHNGLIRALRELKREGDVRAEEQRFARATEIVGIGANFSFLEQRLEVVSLLENSPAGAAGVRPGDRITSIDGHDTASLRSISEVVSRLKGPEGSPIKLVILRRGAAAPQELTITRRKFSIAH